MFCYYKRKNILERERSSPCKARLLHKWMIKRSVSDLLFKLQVTLNRGHRVKSRTCVEASTISKHYKIQESDGNFCKGNLNSNGRLDSATSSLAISTSHPSKTFRISRLCRFQEWISYPRFLFSLAAIRLLCFLLCFLCTEILNPTIFMLRIIPSPSHNKANFEITVAFLQRNLFASCISWKIAFHFLQFYDEVYVDFP